MTVSFILKEKNVYSKNMICYKCKKHIINEKTAVGCIVEDYGIGGISATNAYLCFDCYKKK